MTRLTSAALLAATLIATAAASGGLNAAAVQDNAGLPAAASAELTAFIERGMAQAKVPGLSLAIGYRGQIVYSRGFGSADLEHGVPVKTTTAFRTASLAKPITATAVMQLVEQHKLDLDAPIQRYCPAFPEKPWPVTARQILGHLSGIRHYKPGESGGTTHYFSITDSLAFFKNDPLLHEPGSKYFYSTLGYDVLGCAIEGASGQTYEQYMQTHVFTPAGMTRTRLDRLYDIVPDRARGYLLLTAEMYDALPPAAKAFAVPGSIYNAPLHDTSMKIPGGGLLSTSEDLVRFGTAVMQHRLVTEATQELMWTEARTPDGKGTGYGLGWGVTPMQEGVRRLSHSGNQIGAASVFNVVPEVEVSYAIMTNLEDTDLGPASRGVANILRKYLAGK
jgi:CubicO group peptidase (beta-lactamase class C family)